MELVDSVDGDAELARQLAGSPLASTPPGSSLLRRTLSPGRQAQLEMHAAGSAAAAATLGQQVVPAAGRDQQPGAGQQPHQPQPEAPRAIEIVLSAVGVGLQFVHLDSAGGSNGSGAGFQRPASNLGSAASNRRGSAADLTRVASQPQLVAAAAQAQAPSLAARRPAPARAVQMLAAYLDLSVAYKIEASPLLIRKLSNCPHAVSCMPNRAAASRSRACRRRTDKGAMLPLLLPLLQDLVQSGRVEVQGLRVETRFISGGLAACLLVIRAPSLVRAR